MNTNTMKAAARRSRAASAAQYAARPKAPSPRPVIDMRLRRLTAQVLDDLKLPGAVPSQVIYAALEQAAQSR